MNRVYSSEELDFIRNQSRVMTDAKLTETFNEQFGKAVSFTAMRKLRQRLGIVKKHGRPVKKIDS